MDAKQLLDACVAAAPHNRFVIGCLKHYASKGSLSPDQIRALEQTLAGNTPARNFSASVVRTREPVVACDVRPSGVQYL